MATNTWNQVEDHYIDDAFLTNADVSANALLTNSIDQPSQPKAPLSNAAKAAPSSTSSRTGLSELAKQLRLLQTRNDGQLLEIDRLERQLRILADLSNVSVADLRKALGNACAAEAHEELLNTIARLQNQLEAASLVQSKTAQSSLTTETSASTKHEIASLQLRVGEVEEIEEQQRKELEHLYADLKEQSSSWTRLRGKYDQQQKELDHYRKQVQRQASLQQVVVFEESLPLPPAQSEAIVARGIANVDAQIEQRQLAIVSQQLENAQESHELKEAQHKARNYILTGRVGDLEQQLSSLYTAFHITSQERDSEHEARRALESNLHSADLQVAQYVDVGQKPPVRPVRTSQTTTTTPPTPKITPVVSPAPSVARRSVATPRQLSSPNVASTAPKGDCVMQGTLLLRTSGLMRKAWKPEKRSALYISFTHYNLVLSDGTRLSERTFSAPAGTSKLEPYPKQPFAFTLLVTPATHRAAAVILYLAATNESDYFEWMNAFRRVVMPIASEEPSNFGGSPSESPTFHSNQTTTVEDQEAADLERAIQLSTRQT